MIKTFTKVLLIAAATGIVIIGLLAILLILDVAPLADIKLALAKAILVIAVMTCTSIGILIVKNVGK